MEEQCKCGGDLETIASTRLSQKEDRMERQIFHACNRCNSLYDTKETVIFIGEGLKILNMTALYNRLCKAELKYMPRLEGILDDRGELEVEKELMHGNRKDQATPDYGAALERLR